MSVFAEPLAQARDNIAQIAGCGDIRFGAEINREKAEAYAALDLIEQRAAEMERALADDEHDFGDEAIEDLIRVYFETSDWHGGASATVVDEARKAGRDARAARRARAALSAREETSGSGSSAADVGGAGKHPGGAASGRHESVGERQGRQPDPEELRAVIIELARWSQVATRNGDLHARVASALALSAREEAE